MGALTESEIFDCMAENLRLAAGHCEELAVKPLKGPIYHAFRTELKLVEGACRQASAWREDTRWLPLGLQMEKAHSLAGEWLRGVKDPVTGQRRRIPEGQKHPLFVTLAALLRASLAGVDALRTKKTGRVGMILPAELPGPHRDTRPVSVMLPPGMHRRGSGLLVPDGVAAQ